MRSVNETASAATAIPSATQLIPRQTNAIQRDTVGAYNLAQPITTAIIQGAKARGLDPKAVLAVAAMEGLSGRIGDGGHAFGAFQLNDAGGVLTNKFNGLSPQQKQAWASSPQGISFALDRIAQVARGLKGAQAINAIVTRFERPANPGREIAGANARYGNAPAGYSPPVQGFQPLPQTRMPGAALSPAVASLFAAGNQMFGLPALPAELLGSTTPVARRTPAVVGASPATAGTTIPSVPTSGPTLKFIEHFAAPYGLQVTSTTGGQHAPGSYHYQGRAVDFGGNPASMSRLAAQALSHPGAFKEVIYTGPGNPGFSILAGRRVPNSQLPKALYDQHTNHVHLAR